MPCVVLDIFGGAGTTAVKTEELGRDCILIELNPEYARLAEDRIRNAAPLLTEVEVTTQASIPAQLQREAGQIDLFGGAG